MVAKVARRSRRRRMACASTAGEMCDLCRNGVKELGAASGACIVCVNSQLTVDVSDSLEQQGSPRSCAFCLFIPITAPAGPRSPGLAAGLGRLSDGPSAAAGFDDIHFIDAMTDNIDDDDAGRADGRDQARRGGRDRDHAVDLPRRGGAEDRAARWCPNAVRVLGGVHATFMYKQVLSEAPWIDVIVRGEGEEICTELMLAIEDGRWPADTAQDQGPGLPRRRRDRGDPGGQHRQGPDSDQARLDRAGVGEIHLHPAGHARGDPEPGARLPVHLFVLFSQWKFWRDYRVRDPKDVVDEIEDLVNNHGVGFFILADEEPTINKKKFVAFCQELIDRGLPRPGEMGHQHPRDRHLPRQGSAEVLPQGGAGACQSSAPRPRRR